MGILGKRDYFVQGEIRMKPKNILLIAFFFLLVIGTSTVVIIKEIQETKITINTTKIIIENTEFPEIENLIFSLSELDTLVNGLNFTILEIQNNLTKIIEEQENMKIDLKRKASNERITILEQQINEEPEEITGLILGTN